MYILQILINQYVCIANSEHLVKSEHLVALATVRLAIVQYCTIACRGAHFWS